MNVTLNSDREAFKMSTENDAKVDLGMNMNVDSRMNENGKNEEEASLGMKMDVDTKMNEHDENEVGLGIEVSKPDPIPCLKEDVGLVVQPNPSDIEADLGTSGKICLDSGIDLKHNLSLKKPHFDSKGEVDKMNVERDDMDGVSVNVSVNVDVADEIKPYTKSKEETTDFKYEIAEDQPGDPDIHILIDMDETSNNANFKIEMPDNWSKKLIAKGKETALDSGRRDIFNKEWKRKEREDEKLNVEIKMFIGKENLEDSTVYASINTKKIRSIKLLGESNVDEEICPVVAQNQHSAYNPEDSITAESPPNRFDFRFHLPKIEFPKWKVKADTEPVEADANVHGDLSIDGTPQRRDFRYQLPKVEFPSFGVKGNVDADANAETSVVNDDASMESPTKKWDFRFHLPKVEFPSLSKKEKHDDDVVVDANVNGDVDASIPDSSTQWPYFSFKMHKPNFPSLSAKVDHNPNDDLHIGDDVHLDDSTQRADHRFQLPKVNFPSLAWNRNTNADGEVNAEVDANVPEGEGDIDSLTKRADHRFQLPKVNFPTLSWNRNANADGEVNGEVDANVPEGEGDINSPTKRADHRFQLPKVNFPTLAWNRNANADGEVNADVEGDLNGDEPVTRHDFRFQWPNLSLPSFDIKRKHDDGVDVDGEANLESEGSPSKRLDLRLNLPEVEFVPFRIRPKSHNAVADIDIDLNKTDINADMENPTKRHDFRYQLPKVDLPSWSLTKRSSKDDASLDANGVEHEIELDTPTKRADHSFQFPKINFPSFSWNKNANVDGSINTDIEGNPPDSEVEISSPTKRADHRFQLPTVSLPTFAWNKNASADGEVHAEVDANPVEGDMEVGSPTKRADHRFQLPTVSLPTFAWNRKASADGEVHAEVDANPVEGDMEIGSPTKRADHRFQLPAVHFPSLSWKRNTSTDADGNPDDVEASVDNESSTRFQLPKVNFPTFSWKRNADGEGDIDVDGKAKLGERHDFRFQLPKIEFPSFGAEEKITKTEVDVCLKAPELSFDVDKRRYDFVFIFPEEKFQTVNGRVQFSDETEIGNEEHNEFSIIFDEGETERSDTNIFQVQLKSGILKCRECFEGEWQQEINTTVECLSPKKNVLVVVLPLNDSEVKVSFNEEEIVRYNLQGATNTLQRFNAEGAVRLITAKLYGE